MLLPQAIGYQTNKQKAQCRMWIPPTELLTRGVPETPQTIQAVLIALGCQPELDGKTPFLKTPHT